jgi:hypothetical protein
VAAIVKRVAPRSDDGVLRWPSYADWVFFQGGDRVVDHDDELASWIEDCADDEKRLRRDNAERAKLKNPWGEVVELPSAKVVKS